ncbi:MAG TPA: hypothetical protein VIK01_27900 [Polyangiaceae bacterium]
MSRKGMAIGFWIATALFTLQMGFTAFLRPRVAARASAFAAQRVGVRRLRDRPRLGSHRPPAVGDGPEAWGWAVGTGVLWALSYLFWRRLEAAPASA